MKRCFRWSVGLALLALVVGIVIQDAGEAKAGLITSALVGVVQGDTSSTSGTFLIVDKSSGRTVWQAPASGMSVSTDASTGAKTFTYNTSALDTVNLSGSGSYEWVFRVDGRNASTSLNYQSFTQTVGGGQYQSSVPSTNLQSRIGEALLSGSFQALH